MGHPRPGATEDSCVDAADRRVAVGSFEQLVDQLDTADEPTTVVLGAGTFAVAAESRLLARVPPWAYGVVVRPHAVFVVEGQGRNATTIDMAGHGRLLTIQHSCSIVLANLSVTGGRAHGDIFDSGGVAYIRNSNASLKFANAHLTNNFANNSGAVLEIVKGAVEASDTTFIANVAGSSAAAVLQRGGMFVAVRCVFAEHVAFDGGALLVTKGSAVIDTCVFSRNSALRYGGAIAGANCAEYVGGNQRIAVRNTTFESNHAGHSGGAIAIFASGCRLGPNETDKYANYFTGNMIVQDSQFTGHNWAEGLAITTTTSDFKAGFKVNDSAIDDPAGLFFVDTHPSNGEALFDNCRVVPTAKDTNSTKANRSTHRFFIAATSVVVLRGKAVGAAGFDWNKESWGREDITRVATGCGALKPAGVPTLRRGSACPPFTVESNNFEEDPVTRRSVPQGIVCGSCVPSTSLVAKPLAVFSGDRANVTAPGSFDWPALGWSCECGAGRQPTAPPPKASVRTMQCTACPAGQVSIAQGTCTRYQTCAAGKFEVTAPSATVDRDCEQCDRREFSNVTNARRCTACPSGKYTEQEGQAYCNIIQPCRAGFYITNENETDVARRCSECPAGHWCAEGRIHPCGSAALFCPAGSASPTSVSIGHYTTGPSGDGSRRVAQAACEAGFNCKRGIRMRCEAGRVCRLSSATMVATSNAVVSGQGAGGGGGGEEVQIQITAQERCQDDEYVFNHTACVPCPKGGAVCKDGKVALAKDFWFDEQHGALDVFWHKRWSGALPLETGIYRCAPGACGVDNRTGQVACLGGRSGTLCAVCDKGFYATANASCKVCPTSRDLLVRWLTSMVLLGVALWAGLRLRRWLQEKHKDVAIELGQILPHCLKLLAGMYQILTSFSVSFHAVPWPPAFLNFISFFNVLNLNLFDSATFACQSAGDNFYKRFTAHTISTLALALALVLLLLWSRSSYGFWHGRRVKSSRFWNILLLFLFLVHPSISATVIRMLRCRTVDGKRFLLADLSLSCDVPEYAAYRSLAIAFIVVFPVGILAVFIGVLLHKKAKLPPDWWPLGEKEAAKAAFAATRSMHFVKLKDGKYEADMDADKTKAYTEWYEKTWQPRLNKYDQINDRLGFLFGSYKQRFWWFESVYSVYKIAMTVGVEYVSDETTNKILFSMLNATLLLAGVAYFQPFKETQVLSINSMVQLELLCVLFGAQYLQLNVPNGTRVSMWFGVGMVVLTVTPMYAAFKAAWELTWLHLKDDAGLTMSDLATDFKSYVFSKSSSRHADRPINRIGPSRSLDKDPRPRTSSRGKKAAGASMWVDVEPTMNPAASMHSGRSNRASDVSWDIFGMQGAGGVTLKTVNSLYHSTALPGLPTPQHVAMQTARAGEKSQETML